MELSLITWQLRSLAVSETLKAHGKGRHAHRNVGGAHSAPAMETSGSS